MRVLLLEKERENEKAKVSPLPLLGLAPFPLGRDPLFHFRLSKAHLR